MTDYCVTISLIEVIPMNNFKHDNLEIIATEENGVMKLLWRGSSDARSSSLFLGPFLIPCSQKI